MNARAPVRRVTVVVLVSAVAAAALASEGPAESPGPVAPAAGQTCPSKGASVVASALLRTSGTAAIGATVTFDASASKLRLIRNCELSSRPLPSFSWQLVARPAPRAAVIAHKPGQRASVMLDVKGSYRVRFTACPSTCKIAIGGAVHTVAPKRVETTVRIVPDQPPRAALKVTVRRRAALSWSYWDTTRDTYRPGYVNLNNWRVGADACASAGGTDSTGAPAALTSFRFRFERLDGPADPITRTTSACRLTLGLPAVGRWRVQVTIATAAGRSAGAEGEARDLLVVALGDSMTSGEGNPDTDQKLGRPNGMKLVVVQPAVWKDPQCDRSADSWAARLGRSLENASTSVTFLDFACSGASIDDIVNGGYRGENPQRGDHPVPAEPVAARRVIGDPGSAKTRTVDAVLMTAGINDLNFGDALIFCAKNFVDDCTKQDSGVLIWKGLRALPQRYRELDAAIAANVKVTAARTYVLEYPTRLFTNNDDRPTRCGAFKLHNVTIDEAEWFMRRGDDLNRTLRTAASANGWTFVGDVRDAFRGHGYCADADHTWFRSLTGSKNLQGDEHGTAHPNRAGHAALAGVAGPFVRASRPAPEPVQIVVQLLRVRIDDPAEKPGVPGVHPLTLPQPRHVFFSVVGYAGTSVPAGAAKQAPLGTWVEPGAGATFETVTVGNSIGVKGSITLPSLRINDENAPKGFVDTGTRTLAFERFFRRADDWGVPSSDGRHYGAVQHVLVHGNGNTTLQIDYRIGAEPLR